MLRGQKVLIQIALFLYGLTAIFVLMSVERNRKEERDHAPALLLAGWSVMSASAVLAILLLGTAAVMALGYPVTLTA